MMPQQLQQTTSRLLPSRVSAAHSSYGTIQIFFLIGGIFLPPAVSLTCRRLLQFAQCDLFPPYAAVCAYVPQDKESKMLQLLTRTNKYAVLPAVLFAASLGLAACDVPDENNAEQMPEPQDQQHPVGQ